MKGTFDQGSSDKPLAAKVEKDVFKEGEEAALDLMKRAAEWTGTPAAQTAVDAMERTLHPDRVVGNGPSAQGLAIGVEGKADASATKALPLPGVSLLEAGSEKTRFGDAVNLGLQLELRLGTGGRSGARLGDASGGMEGLSGEAGERSGVTSTNDEARLSDAGSPSIGGDSHAVLDRSASLADKSDSGTIAFAAGLTPTSLDASAIAPADRAQIDSFIVRALGKGR